MDSTKPDRLNASLMIALLGAILAIIGWFRARRLAVPSAERRLETGAIHRGTDHQRSSGANEEWIFPFSR